VDGWIIRPSDEFPSQLEERDPLFHLGLDRDIPTIICDSAKEERISHGAYFTGEPRLRFLVLASVKSDTGVRFARLGMGDREPRPEFSLNDCDYLIEAVQKVGDILLA